jgi:hypothetical protein
MTNYLDMESVGIYNLPYGERTAYLWRRFGTGNALVDIFRGTSFAILRVFKPYAVHQSS